MTLFLIEFDWYQLNIDCKMKWEKWVSDDRGCYDPVLPRFTPVWPRFSFEIAIFEVKFEVTSL